MTNFIDKDKVLYMLSGRIADCVEIADGANEETDKETKDKYLEAASRYTRMYKFIAQLPTVEAEPVKRGRIEADGYTYTCSVCESRLFEHDLFWRYCPYCGARLDDTEDTGKNL